METNSNIMTFAEASITGLDEITGGGLLGGLLCGGRRSGGLLGGLDLDLDLDVDVDVDADLNLGGRRRRC